jgi:hypothetical protein
MRLLVLLFAGVVVLAVACGGKAHDDAGDGGGDGGYQGSCSVASSTGGCVPTGPCNFDPTIACSGDAEGYSCVAGYNPEADDLSCSTPTVRGDQNLYCCFEPTSAWPRGTCLPDDTLTSVCPAPDSYAYVCNIGNDPSSFDPDLSCSAAVPDADGVHDDFCCTYHGGSSSSDGGSPPLGCKSDGALDCLGGAYGYACATGNNPESEDPGLSCSTRASSDGEDDYCCFSGFSGSNSTCEPDDDLTTVCPDPTSYGYQCDSGDDPSSYDATLNCSTSTPDPDGVHDDYCCTF